MPTFDLTAANTQVLIIDMQERFLPVIPAMAGDQSGGRNCRILMEAAKLLQIPATISEQYPKGLGPTLPGLLEANPDARRLEKTHFSCSDDPILQAHLDRLGRPRIIVAGIEAQVCVLSTVADLLARGYGVVVAGDAVASRKPEHLPLALAAMRDLGALVVPSESIILRVQRQAGIGCFKSISALIK